MLQKKKHPTPSSKIISSLHVETERSYEAKQIIMLELIKKAFFLDMYNLGAARGQGWGTGDRTPVYKACLWGRWDRNGMNE